MSPDALRSNVNVLQGKENGLDSKVNQLSWFTSLWGLSAEEGDLLCLCPGSQGEETLTRLLRHIATQGHWYCQGSSGCKEEKPTQIMISQKQRTSKNMGVFMPPEGRKCSWAPGPERHQVPGQLPFQTVPGPDLHGVFYCFFPGFCRPVLWF